MMTIFDFKKQFPNEQACFDYLFKKKWPNGFLCPHCNHKKAYRLEKRKLMQCASCKYQASVTAGTVFHKLRQPLYNLLWTCYWVATTKKGISALELRRKLGIKSYQTAWTLLHKIRKAMKSSGAFPISSNVEFDDTYLTTS
jgi:transposase-like protein